MSDRCPCCRERWASLEGWRPDLNRPGYLYHPSHPGWLRDRLGHWSDAKVVDGVRRAVDEAVAQAALETPQERFRKALKERRGP